MSTPLRCARKRSSAARAPWTWPKRFVSMTARKTSSGTSSKRPYAITPAQLTHTSRAPKRSTDARASAWTAASSRTSVGTAMAGAPMRSISSASVCSGPAERAARTSRERSRAKA
jgi:hypothetical protein